MAECQHKGDETIDAGVRGSSVSMATVRERHAAVSVAMFWEYLILLFQNNRFNNNNNNNNNDTAGPKLC
jgi:uncharacterized membrane protein